jgi:hypothetical protein
MKIKILLIFMLFCCPVQAQKVKYYKHANTINIKDFSLRYPIDENLAKSANCYRIQFDLKNRVIDFRYFEDGKPALKKALNSGDSFARLTIEYSDSGEIWRYLDPNGRHDFPDSNISYISYLYNSKGYPVEKINYGLKGNIIEDTAGVAKYLYTNDENGRIVKVLRTNIQGDTIIDNNGEYERRLYYGDKGYIIEDANYSAKNELLDNNKGVAITKYQYDEFCNISQISFLNSKRRPVLDGNLNAAIVKTEYDNSGNIINMACYGLDNSQATEDSNLISRITASYDEKGNRLSLTANNYDSTSTVGNLRMWFDEAGNKIKTVTIFNAKAKSGLAKLEVLYDTAGNAIAKTYYDKEGNIIK